MSNSNQSPPATPKSVLDTLKEWRELITFVALTLASVLGGVLGKWFGSDRVQIVSVILAVLFVAIGAYVVQRKRKRKLEQDRREKIWAEHEAQRKPQAAFRSLAPFEERDELPGKDRKIEARSIATRIASDDFRFGVICGDTGCGKTSLLRSEVTRVLQESGFEVAYVRNPQRLESKTSEALPPTERLASELRALARNYIKLTTGAVILDQFEEWFIEYQEPEHRVQIGTFIRKLAERPQRVRIVCAIRSEFLIDFHDLSDELPEQLSTTNLFHLKNFTVDQAMDVISQCATADGLVPDESFAETVAHDLAEGGQVRPPELQIVCTYLAVSGGLITRKYRQAGGTAGILAHYIQDGLSSSKAPDVGARLLRALCDFSTRAKRKPRTLDELTSDVQTDDSISDSNLKNTVAELVHHFVLGRIVAEEQRRDEAMAFALMHDYLVDAVQLATSDVSTKTEEANQLLRYYIAEERTTIPIRKLRFIKRFAERRYLEELAAKRLMRRSKIAPILWCGIIAFVAVTLAAGIYLTTTAQIQWQSEVIRRHWPEGESGSVEVERMLGKGRVLTRNLFVFEGRPHVRIWDVRTGELFASVENSLDLSVDLGPSADFLLLSGDFRLVTETGPARLVNLSTLAETKLPASAFNFRFSKSGNWITWMEGEGGNRAAFVIYSLSKQNVTHRVAGLQNYSQVPIYHDTLPIYTLADAGDRLVILRRDGSRSTAYLYDTSSGKQIATLADNAGGDTKGVSIHDGSSRVCTTARLPSGDILLRLWNLRNGEVLGEARLELGVEKNVEAQFSSDGSHLIIRHSWLTAEEKHPLLLVLQAADFEPAKNIPVGQLRAAWDGYFILFWGQDDATVFWDASKSDPQMISALSIGEHDRLEISENHQRAVVWARQTRTAELWDFTKGRFIARLSHTRPLDEVSFTVDDKVVVLKEEGDVFSLFDALDGELLVQNSPVAGGKEISYDRDCRQIIVWNESGQVIRYTEGREYFWTFVPTLSCK